MRTIPDGEQSVRCTESSCSCACFTPGSVRLRSCDRCGHGWVAHALDKLHFQAQQPSSCSPVEVALPGTVFDLSSLVLYGAQAVPVRLKILLDRLYSILTTEQVSHILHTLGWSLGDYVRGYMLQLPSGKVLDRWLMVTPEEELLILKQFLRFGETRPIVELMTLQCLAAVNHLSEAEFTFASKSCRSNIHTFIELNGETPAVLRNTTGDSDLVAGVRPLKENSPAHHDTIRHFENLSGEQSLLLPLNFPGSAVQCLALPTKELAPRDKLTQCLRKPNRPKLAERHGEEGGRRGQDNNLILQQSKCEPDLKIKAEPDKPNLTLSVCHHDPRLDGNLELDLHTATQEATFARPSSSNSLLISTSSALHPSFSPCYSPLKISRKLQGSSSSSSLHLLPSFSSSFLCPIPSSTFSSSLRPLSSSSSSLCPLPSSLCSLPSFPPAGGRKGRVCCGVCGKSFYDKGTLKIHYNAVHLKIKHRCTVAGCTMVFSSLRSRNRHSANPNPRLHTSASRNAHTDPHTSVHSETLTHRDKSARKDTHYTHTKSEISSTIWKQEDEAHRLAHTLRNRSKGESNPQHGCQDSTHPQADSPPPPPPHALNRTLIQDTNQAQPPPPLLPVCSASSLGSPASPEKTRCCRHLLNLHTIHMAPAPLPRPTLITLASSNCQNMSHDHDITEVKRGEACTSPLTNNQRQWVSSDHPPKKKPRKSSMPVKIERGKAGEEGNEEEEEC
uniref:zinc finger protein basonuclin-2-like n=1 Tax=Scatophagus argus TaxID=75038 RepID=UPI001ED82E5D|nr:zinc finger protein basonuclin-2-like [Scatophagus argus]